MFERNPEYVLYELYAAYAAGDVAGALAYCTDDVVYVLNLPTDVVPFGGEAHGKVAFHELLMGIGREFETVSFRPGRITITGKQGHAQVHFCFRHRATRMELDGVMRHEIVFENGRISCIREYHDTERVRAFMQLVAASMAEAI